jgi:hypothetical protein
MTLSELESHLWESANILRGPVDAADFKTYIFPDQHFSHRQECDGGIKLEEMLQHADSL